MSSNSTTTYVGPGAIEQKIWLSFLLSLLYNNPFKILSCLYAAKVAYDIFLHPLHKVPGPFLARFSEQWRNIRYFRGTWLDDVVQLHEKYGPVVRIAPNEVSFVDEAALKILYGHGQPSQKTSWYDTWSPPSGQSFFAVTDRSLHRHMRSRVSGTYSMSAMLGMQDLVEQVLEQNVKKLRELVQRGKAFRLDIWAGYFAFDVVGQLSMGGMIGFQEQERDVDSLISSIHTGFYLMSNMGNIPLKMWWFNNSVTQFLARHLGGDGSKSFQTFIDWLDARVTERMSNGLGDRRRDMLQYFIEVKDQEGKPLNKEAVMSEAANVLGAGADTTTVAILAIIGALLQHPAELKLLRAEIDAAYEQLGLAHGTQEIDFRDAEKLPYLSAVIRESMRLHPSITYQLPRVPPAEGIQIGEYFIPPSATCGISPASMNRDRKLFGSDAMDWKPARWIPRNDSEEEAKRLRVMEQRLTTFGMGSRNCVGRNLALVEIFKYTAVFFRHFEAELVNPDKPWVVKSQWFAYQQDFWITAKERQI